MSVENYQDVSLELGAIIKLVSETNPIYHNKYFLIDYLDNDKIIIVDKNKTSRKLNIKDGQLQDQSISQIIIVDRPEHPGFAKQNGMEIGTWWSIHFSFDGGEIIKGKIVGLENDQIELECPDYPEAPLVIDFEYKGIPQDLNIVSIKRWNKEDEIDEVKEEEQEDLLESFKEDEIDGMIDIIDDELIPDEVYDSKEIEDEIKENIIAADKIKIIKTDVTVTQVKSRVERDRVYDIDYQVEDLLDNLLSKIPDSNRTYKNENKIHTTINRYLHLREEFSNINSDDYIEGVKLNTQDHKPLLNSLHDLNKNIDWIVPVVTNRIEISDIQNVADANDDVILSSSANDINDMMEQQENMFNDTTPDGINKYLHVYGKSTSNINTPFLKDSLLIEKKVNDDYYTIIDNRNNFNSSAIQQITNHEICLDASKKLSDDASIRVTDIQYQTTMYNKNKMVPFYDKREGKNAIFKELLSSDKIPLKGFVFIPSMIKQSHLSLPNTNLYDKTIINQNKKYYFELFKIMKNNNKFTGKSLIFDKNNKKMFHKHFNKSITHYSYSDKDEWEDKSDNDKEINYKEFLNSIIPNTRDIIKNLCLDLSNNFIKVTSYDKLMQKMEPYLIYDKDIHLFQYIEIQKQLQRFIREYYKDIGFSLNNLNHYYNQLKSYESVSFFFDFFKNNNAFKDIDCKCYNFKENESNVEYIKTIMETDNGVTFNNCVALNDVANINYESIPEKIETLKNEINDLKNQMEDGSDCTSNPKVLAKKFKSFELIRKDDNKDIFFDKIYDDTRYDILDELPYIKDMDDLIKKKTLLKNHLIETIGLTDEDAERDAETMITGSKKIVDGEYAMVDTGEYNFRYYKRKNNKWVLDDSLSNLSPEELNFVNCNMKGKCLTINDKCIDIKNQKGKLQEELIAETIEGLETNMIEEVNTVKERLEKDIKNNMENLTLLRRLIQNKKCSYDFKKVVLSNEVEMEDNEPSPYLEVRDRILTETDDIIKYDNIIKFHDNYCRNYSKIKDEDPNWFYCKNSEGSKKLLPSFYLKLAIGFQEGNLSETLKSIIDERGTLSPELGDKYVDKHSGHVITTTAYEEQQMYEKSGQKIIMRDVIDTSDDDKVKRYTDNLLKEEVIQQKMTKDEAIIRNLLETYDENLGFNTKKKHDFMYEYVKNLIKRSRQRKVDFDADTKKMQEKAKDPTKTRSWTKYHHKFIFKSVISIYAVVIQTSIPHIKQGKSVTPCTTSLDGFPMGKSMDFLEYLTCATLKFRVNNKEAPWNCLKKVKKSTIKSETTKFAKEIKSWIDKYFIKKVEIKSLIDEKLDYMNNEKKNTSKNNEVNNPWETFLPPLVKISTVSNDKMGDGYDKKIFTSYKNVSDDSIQRLNKLRSKIQKFSFAIIESMQRVIDKQPLLLKTEDDIPFQENACCNDNNVLNTYEYFVTFDESIDKYNELVKQYNNVLRKHNNIIVAPTLISQINTKNEKSVRSFIFSEKTVYSSFIKYCMFNSGIKLDEQLKQICNNNESKFLNLDSLESKIETLKSEGHNWNDESLKQLLLYISRKHVDKQNILKEDSSRISTEARNISSSRSQFENYIESLDENDVSNHLKELIPVVKKLYDTYDITQSDKELKSGVVIDFTEEVIEKIKFVNKKSQKNLIKKLQKISNTKNTIIFIENIQEFFERGENLFMSRDDETHYYHSEFIRNMINDMLITYPYLIMNNENDRYSMKKILLPKHWGFGSKKFSDSHINKIKSTISQLSNLEKYSCDEICNVIIKNVLKKKNRDPILQFIDTLPFLSNIDDNKSIFNGRIKSVFTVYMFFATINLYYQVVEDIIENLYNKNDPEQESEYYGAMDEYVMAVTNILNTYFNIFRLTKKVINKNPELIKNDVLKEKELEKEYIKDQFNRLDDEHRKIEREMKNLKLGEWSVGLSKSVFQYDPQMYERENELKSRIDSMMSQNNIQMSAQEMNVENNMLSSLTGEATDLILQQRAEQEIDNERYGLMNEMGDDDDWNENEDMY